MLVQANGAPICVCEFTAAFDLPQQNVSYHLKQLIDAGVIARERRGRFSYYALVTAERTKTSDRTGRLSGLRGFPPLSGVLRQSQVASSAGSARDQKKPAVVCAYPVNENDLFAGLLRERRDSNPRPPA